jgi:hypothetical protein
VNRGTALTIIVSVTLVCITVLVTMQERPAAVLMFGAGILFAILVGGSTTP